MAFVMEALIQMRFPYTTLFLGASGPAGFDATRYRYLPRPVYPFAIYS